MSVSKAVEANSGFPPAYLKYDTQFPGEKEVIGWSLWDTVTYVSAATLQLNMFNAVRATPDLSNMELGGQLAAPKGFFLRAIRFYPKQLPDSNTMAATTATQVGVINDMQQLLQSGALTLTVGNKRYVELPLWAITAGGGAVGYAECTDPDELMDYATNGVCDPRAVYTLSIPMFIAPQINFQVQLLWPAAITLALGNTTLTVVLDGDLVRPIQ